MEFDVEDAVKRRISVRTFDGRPLSEADREKLVNHMEQVTNPFHVPVRFRFLDHAGTDRAYSLGTKGVVIGTETYVAAAVDRNVELALEAFGYAFEEFVLFAASLGIGTVILAATLDRPGFESALELSGDEIMPTITPVGYPAAKRSLRDSAMRKGLKADQRLGWEQLFFKGEFGQPLSRTDAALYEKALEAVRLAPSATNKQPWRVVEEEGSFHFFEQKARGMAKDPSTDIQRVDLGIALCHFGLMAESAQLAGRWARVEMDGDARQKLHVPDDAAYTVSWATNG